MKRIRIKKEIALVWAVTTNGHEESLVGRNLSLFLVDPKYRKTAKTFHIENGNEVHFRVYPSEQPFTGVYTLELWENLGGQDQTVVDKRSAFELVNFTPQECDGSVDDIHAAEVFIGSGNLAVGIHGRGIVSVTKVSEDPDDWNYRILYDDGATETIQIARGEKGLTDEEHAELIAETLAAKSAAQSANLAATLAASKAAEAAEAAQTANDAAEAATAAKEAADAATEAAQEATTAANAAKTAANNAATLANNAAANANTKAALAQAAADATNAAIAAASTATAAANAATAAANTAAATANSAASNASAKATLANNAANNANNAAVAANAAKDAANSAASAANAAAALANDAAARAEAAILTIENKIERVELVCDDDQHITRKGSSVALTYEQVKALVDDPKNFVTLRYLDMFWMLPSYDDGGAIMFTSSGIEFGHVVVTRVILNTDGQMNNYSIIAEDSDHKTNDMSKETAMDGHLTYPTTRAVNGEFNAIGNLMARSIAGTPTEQTFAGTRVTAGGAAIGDGVAYISRVKGRTLKVVQLPKELNDANYDSTNATLTFAHNSATFTASARYGQIRMKPPYKLNLLSGHKYLYKANFSGSNAEVLFQLRKADETASLFSVGITPTSSGIFPITDSVQYYIRVIDTRTSGFSAVTVSNIQLFDLTAMFGAGNEPTTPQAFAEALGYPSIDAVPYFAYTEGRLIPSHVEGVKSTGRNLIPTEGFAAGKWINANGEEEVQSGYYLSPFIPVESNTAYRICGRGTSRTKFYDANKKALGSSWAFYDSMETAGTSLAGAAYIRISFSLAEYNKNMRFLYKGTQSREFEPYEANERKWSGILSQFFPDGMKSAGAVFDEFTPKRVTKRLVRVNLKDLTWTMFGVGVFNAKSQGLTKSSGVGICSRYTFNPVQSVGGLQSGQFNLYEGYWNNSINVKDTNYTTLDDFIASLDGVIADLELATPIVTEIPELPMWFEAFNGGTEEAITAEESAPLVAEIGYNENPATALNLL